LATSHDYEQQEWKTSSLTNLHVKSSVIQQFPDYNNLDCTYTTLNTNNKVDIFKDTIQNNSSHTVFYMPEVLKTGFLEIVHQEMQQHNINGSDVTICCGSMNPSIEKQYHTWCKDNNHTPCVILFMEMFSDPYTRCEENSTHVTVVQRNKHFLCLNRSVRQHRIECVAWLYNNNLLSQGLVSCKHPNTYQESTITDISAWKSQQGEFLPYKVDGDLFETGGSIQVGEINAGKDAHFQIVTETFFYDASERFLNDLFVTEKTYKTFFTGHPFVVIGDPGTIAHVRNKGFDVFDDVINHEYDLVQDHHTRMLTVLTEIQRLCTISLDDWAKIRADIMPRLLKNWQIYTNELKNMPKKI